MLLMNDNMLESATLGFLGHLHELTDLDLTDNPMKMIPRIVMKPFGKLGILSVGCGERNVSCITIEENSLATEQTMEKIIVGCMCDLNPLQFYGICIVRM